jgi:hypothetical protein
MKTQRNFIMVVLGIFCNFFANAQMTDISPSRWLVIHKQDIANAAYIFEGTTTQEKSYYGKHGIMTCNVIQITKIYKGSPKLKLGTIKVLTVGGRIGNEPYDPPSDGGWIRFTTGATYIILGIPAAFERASDSIIVNSITTDNLFVLEYIDHISFLSNDTVRWDYDMQFKTKEDVYSFFKENGLMVQEEQK